MIYQENNTFQVFPYLASYNDTEQYVKDQKKMKVMLMKKFI